jgi:hypothetical protein
MAPTMPWPNCSMPSNCQPDDALMQGSRPTPRCGPRVCGIGDAFSVVGDRWALLVLRELDFGVHRFNDIQANTGAGPGALGVLLGQLAGPRLNHEGGQHPCPATPDRSGLASPQVLQHLWAHNARPLGQSGPGSSRTRTCRQPPPQPTMAPLH